MDPPVPEPAGDQSVRAVAALDDDQRRRLYAFTRDARHPVTRQQAAAGISRKLAAFHLDKLVDVGLLRARYGPAGGIRRVGRAPKLYEPAGRDVLVSNPARHHQALAQIFIDAVLTETEAENAQQAALRVARARGHDLGS